MMANRSHISLPQTTSPPQGDLLWRVACSQRRAPERATGRLLGQGEQRGLQRNLSSGDVVSIHGPTRAAILPGPPPANRPGVQLSVP